MLTADELKSFFFGLEEERIEKNQPFTAGAMSHNLIFFLI